MTLTAHKNQVLCPGVVQWWVRSSLMTAAFRLQRQVVKLACRLFYCWVLLRNNNMATNLHVITSNYGSRRFAACSLDASNAGRQWVLIVDSHIQPYVCSLLCKKKHRKYEKSIVSVRLNACPVYMDESSSWKSQQRQARIYRKAVSSRTAPYG